MFKCRKSIVIAESIFSIKSLTEQPKKRLRIWENYTVLSNWTELIYSLLLLQFCLPSKEENKSMIKDP